ncbi:hypothetical protein FKM82_026199 [Ascaphus truei]
MVETVTSPPSKITHHGGGIFNWNGFIPIHSQQHGRLLPNTVSVLVSKLGMVPGPSLWVKGPPQQSCSSPAL